jgi:hypothetical protein
VRPFPFQGDHFFNLQWRSGHESADFVWESGDVPGGRRALLKLRRTLSLAALAGAAGGMVLGISSTSAMHAAWC